MWECALPSFSLSGAWLNTKFQISSPFSAVSFDLSRIHLPHYVVWVRYSLGFQLYIRCACPCWMPFVTIPLSRQRSWQNGQRMAESMDERNSWSPKDSVAVAGC